MKRTVPLWITAACGFVLIAAHFSPYTQSWGEVTMIWFDILASIAFVLGGGNLLAIHMKKIVEVRPGWAYSAITIMAFAATLCVGMVKLGSPPAARQEYFGETFAPLPLADFPQTYSVEGAIPEKTFESELPPSVVRQLDELDGRLQFRGWMLPDQEVDLLAFKDQLAWRCAVERLAEEAQPPESLRGRVLYHVDHEALAFRGHMTEAQRTELLALGESDAWLTAVETLYKTTQVVSVAVVEVVPEGFGAEQAAEVSPAIRFDPVEKTLAIQGPMSIAQREALARQFPLARPMPKDDPHRKALLSELTDRGPLSAKQIKAFNELLDAGWTADELIEVLNDAGVGQPVPKTYCEMLAEQQQGVALIEPMHPKSPDQRLTPEDEAKIRSFAASDDLRPQRLEAELADALNPRQAAALGAFLAKVPTRAEQRKDLCLALLKAYPLTQEQDEWLLADYRRQLAWQTAVGRLFGLAHMVKFPWSGEYNAQGTPFWWLYEYAMKPLTATMFAMLAFYVASAAFRAFRAKNLEATLLLGTAFIILLGRTFAGAVATAWLPDWLSGLKIENLTVTIMAVFNTAGTRAIMIGIALGIASTSLKVLLGIDRSYLGAGEE